MITRQLSLGTRMLVPDPLGEGVNCLLLRKLGSSHFRPHLQIQQSSSTRHTPVPPVRPELQGVQPESRVALGSRQGSLLGTGLPSHAPGALARVAGGQGAAPPGGSTAAEEREEGSSLEALAAQAAVSLVAYQTSTNWVTLGLPPRTCSPVSCLLALRETHPYYDLQVKVLRARNIRGTDLLSKADCYVQLWLPTASPSPTQTRTVANCSDPEWNEVFHYQIHGAVKNVLELTLYDKDVLGSDQLSLLLFDLRSLRPGQPHRHTFLLDRQDSQELQVEFVLEKSQVPASEVITNGVLVVQPCLRIQGTLGGDERAPHRDYGYRQIQLAVPGAYEKPQLLPLKYPVEQSLPSTFTFHVNPVLSSSLDIELWEKLMVLQSSPSAELEAQNSKLGEGGIVLSSLPLGREEQRIVALGEGQEVTLSVKAEMSSGDLDLRLGFDLCDGEQEFLDKRKQVVSKALQKVLGLSEAPDSGQVPVVAVLGSGGGTRAMSSLYGSLAGLQELGFLDTVTYLSGVSGSTWCISTIYKNPTWSQVALQGPMECAQARVCSSKMGALSKEQLQYYAQELGVRESSGHSVSLIDLWGLLIEYFLYQEENAAKLSDQQEAVSQGQNPYPIYASVNVRTNISGEDFAEWCEFTPYEVGFPKYGAYVPTELFSSEFFMGRLLKLRPEPRICYLQGVWGSAFAASLDEIFLKTAGLSLGFLDSHRGSVDITDDCQKLQQPDPARLRTRLFTPQGPFSQAVLDICTSRFTSAETFNFTRGLCLHKDYVAGREFVAWKDTHPDAFPNELTPMKDCLYLVDGGFAINSPFPLALLPQRAVDLILSFDYSLDAPFEVLQMTEKYCRDRGIPFPKIEVCPGDLEEPRECYLFAEAEDPRSPIVLHFPLVNHTFRTHLAPVVERQTAEEKAFGDFVISGPDTPYGMMNFTYKPEEFDRLVALSRYNVLNNAETLRGALCLALDRRQAGG
ncbi:cytosolic phospholipase A2 zeta isoform X2 [Choloepus didactylus]|uniref:cytosolic phospholipase A2 zeta isoform X2 n=1 Tax=Choloepus didactylus TaxID=27675 RepID=UPI00189DE9FB|nr:cytosolic phospholipase A2 zeta isoform X2 [Choloepus didactylus]